MPGMSASGIRIPGRRIAKQWGQGCSESKAQAVRLRLAYIARGAGKLTQRRTTWMADDIGLFKFDDVVLCGDW